MPKLSDGSRSGRLPALRAAAQIYRGRYPGRGLETARLLPIVEQAFAVLLGPAQPG